jgi:hypothetical protein
MDPNLLETVRSATNRRLVPGDPLVPHPTHYPRWLKIFGCIAVVDVLAFMLVATYLGGDALNGHVSNGHYFLAAKGRTLEVSRELYIYSKWHGLSAIAMAIATVSAWAIVWRRTQMARSTGPYVS